VVKNVCKLQKAPKVPESEMVIVQDVPGFVALLRAVAGRRLYAPAIVALFTGMRLGEVLALREGRVDLDKGVIEVREALEETKTYGVRFKTAKTKAGRRNVTNDCGRGIAGPPQAPSRDAATARATSINRHVTLEYGYHTLFPSTSRPHESQLAPHPSEYVRRNPQSDPLRQGCKPRCGAGSPEIR
jgi:integrase